MSQLKMLISHEHKLIYVWVPKCGSSTLFRVFQVLVGVPKSAEVRRVDVTDAFLSDYNAVRLQVKKRQIAEFTAQYPDYRRIAIVRNPYDRLLSAYHNKIDRFARQLMPEACADIEEEIAAARQEYSDIPHLRRKLHKRISLDDMIHGLKKHGTGFDAHFLLQSQHLHPDIVTYDRVFRLESMDQDLANYLLEIGISDDVIANISKLPRHNRTKTGWFTRPKFNNLQRQAVFDIYQADFDTFGYPK